VVLAAAAFRWGRRWTNWEMRTKGLRRFGPFLFPLTVIATAVFMKELFDRFIRLAGYPYYLGTLVLTLITDLAISWLIAVLLTQVGELVIRNTRAGERPLNAQLVRLSFRILTIVVVGGYLFTAAERLGLPVPALVAGLGVGGLAVALATQGTLENLIGGLILYADQPVRVGDFFRFGDKMGVVEEVGIRSARIRTLDRTIVAIPNAELVKMPLENFSRRDRIRLRTLLRLRMETTPDQLRFLLTRLWQMIERHPRLIRDTGSARLVDLGEYSLDVELVAYASTSDWTEFLAIRQDVFLQVMGLVDEAGTRLAVPAQLELEAPAPGLDEERARAAEQQARRWREEGNPLVPEYPEAGPGTEGGDPG
jgi:MscS family membrane protein